MIKDSLKCGETEIQSSIWKSPLEVDSIPARFIRYGLAILMSTAMIGVSEYLNEPEIVFPEIAALVIGAWAAPRQPWNVSKIKMVILISISAILGVLLVRSGFIPLYLQILIGFAFCGVSLTLTHSSFVPVISACILPVLMKTESWIYPISVFVMTVIIVVVQFILESTGLRIHRKAILQPGPFAQLKRWGLLLGVLAALSAIPVFVLKDIFYIAPPLIVAYVELSSPTSPVRNRALAVWLLISAAALLGGFGRLLICQYLGLSAVICCILSLLILIFLMERSKLFFPPAGAICLLPLIIKEELLTVYPFQVIIGSGVLICAAMLLGKSFHSRRYF